MSAEEIRKALMQPISVETRLDWLEADSAAQRTAILKLEREVRWHRVALWILSGFVYLWTLWRLFL
jgi:uncharacterized membrane protein